MINNKKKGSVKLYFCFMILFILWLLFSNNIILAVFAEKTNFFSASNTDPSMYHNQVYCGIDLVEGNYDLLENVNIKGWAFVESLSSSSNRYISAFLQNPDICYQARFQVPEDPFAYSHIIIRDDVSKAYSDKVQHSALGFVGEFSLLNVKDGIYKLYIYCWENEENYGLADTGRWFKKDGSSFTEWQWESETITQAWTKISDQNARGAIDVIKIDGDHLDIRGWALMADQDTMLHETYIEISYNNNNILTYTTDTASRPDIAEAFGEHFVEHGFHARIPLRELTVDTGSIRIIVKYEDDAYASKEYTLVRTGDSILLQQ